MTEKHSDFNYQERYNSLEKQVEEEFLKIGLKPFHIEQKEDGALELQESGYVLFQLEKMIDTIVQGENKRLKRSLLRYLPRLELNRKWNKKAPYCFYGEYDFESDLLSIRISEDLNYVVPKKTEQEWLDEVYEQLIQIGYEKEVQEIKLMAIFDAEKAQNQIGQLNRKIVLNSLLDKQGAEERLGKIVGEHVERVRTMIESFNKKNEKMNRGNKQ